MSKRTLNCIYCGMHPGDTRDHAPPKCFFGSELPKNMITVPCCDMCRKASEKNETMLRNLLISLEETESHPTVKSVLQGKCNRSYRYRFSEFKKLAAMTGIVEVFSSGGIYLRKDLGFNLDHPVVHRFVERMSRAVLYEEFRQPHFVGEFGWRLNPTLHDNGMPHDICMRWIHENLPGKKLADISYYRTTHSHATNPWWINMFFYERVHIMARVQKMRAGKCPSKPDACESI